MIGADQSQHQLDQRGLAGAVMADQGTEPPGAQVERDVPQRLHRAVALDDAIHGDGGGHRRLRLDDGLGGGAISGRVSTTPPG